ncbi:MAG: class I SAM-dependent methyltransferase [Candidatus Aenigmatarchaeota archaeon]
MPRGFPNWDDVYKNEDPEKMPWFSRELDSDLDETIKKMNINSGSFLDLGTGPGSQAIRLSEKGFEVTGSDISEHAIEKAKKLESKINFVVDDILDTKLPKESYDYIFDRGCFHVLEPEQREKYIENVLSILKTGGILFLKLFSKREPEIQGPQKFDPDEIKIMFEKYFEIESIEEIEYQSDTLTEKPKALFCILKKK